MGIKKEVSPELEVIYKDVKNVILMMIRQEVNDSVEIEIDKYNYRVFYSANPLKKSLSLHITAQGIEWGWLRYDQINDKVVMEDYISGFDLRYELLLVKIMEWLYNKFSNANINYSNIINDMIKSFNIDIPHSSNESYRIGILEQKIRDLESLLIKEKPKIIGLKGTI